MLSDESETATKWAKACVEAIDPGKEIETLEEWVRWRARMLVCGLALAGYGRVRVIQGYRSIGETERLYGQGRSADRLLLDGVDVGYARPEELQVTWILPRLNRHRLRLAIDIDLSMYQSLNENAIVTIARSVGMTWGGVWSVRDTYHFEV